ncbi:MAG: DMT family transporter [Lacibacter sp.]
MQQQRSNLTGILLAVVATLIWSGNFIVARGVAHAIPPISLAFYRWLTATLIMLPIAAPALWQHRAYLRRHAGYLLRTALFGVTLFNTFVYVAGHYSTAINLALIGTTTSPVFSILLARLFLGERLPAVRVAGLFLCITGIVWLLSKGSITTLLHLRFGPGDAWILAAALAFAIYNIQVRKQPPGLPGTAFLLAVFAPGTLLLLPAWLVEAQVQAPVQWNANLLLIILYLGAGTSVIAFLCWNVALRHLGAGRTALFGNLIPVFSTIEAILILHERLTWIHLTGGTLVVAGLVLANLPALGSAKSS